VAHFAGAETMKEVGQLSPLTLCLAVTNADGERARKVNMRASGSSRLAVPAAACAPHPAHFPCL
jgi:hypothetical protein